HGQAEHHGGKGETAPCRGEGPIEEALRHEIDHERQAQVGPNLETALPACLHCPLLPSMRGPGYTEQLAGGAGGGEFPGESCVLGMHGVDEQICWLSMIYGEGRKSSYAIKMRGSCDKCL